MKIHIAPDKRALGRMAAAAGAAAIRDAIAAQGEATIIVATGASQFEMLEQLTSADGIDWSRVTAFHLDEYVGMPESHPASFRKYLSERFVAPLRGAATFIPVAGDVADPKTETKRLGALIAARQVDVCFAGIGENCHLAFNDPPADFVTTEPYIVVALDDACRMQQFGEGWFPTLDAVPTKAISMSIAQMMRSKLIVLSVPDARKAAAVRDAVEGDVDPQHPASILQRHPNAMLYLDPHAAALLTKT